MAILMITHDLSTAAHFADRIAVMYLGRIVEEGPAKDVVRNPQHPYTKALISVVPKRDPRDPTDAADPDRRDAEPGASSPWVPVPSPLPDRAGELPQLDPELRAPAKAADIARPPRRVPSSSRRPAGPQPTARPQPA